VGRVPAWRKILDDLEDEPADDDVDEEAPASGPAEVEDRRDIFDILVRAASIDADQVSEELARAVRPSGKLVPPLVLLAGDVSFAFAPRETLKANVAAAMPLAGTDEALKAAIKDARELLATSDVLCSPQLYESFTTRIRDAFQKARRGAATDYLDTQVEAALVEGRHYQRRSVLGMNAIRAFLHSATASGARPVPAYIPVDAEPKLPLYQRFRARMIAEVHLQGDQQEQHPASLKVLVLGRLTQMPERRSS
jgi:hypothetical protein